MELIEKHFHRSGDIRDPKYYCSFIFENKIEKKIFKWELVNLEKNEWLMGVSNRRYATLKKIMKQDLYAFKKHIENIEKREDGLSCITEITEIQKNGNSISCKAHMNGTENAMKIQFSIWKGGISFSYINFPNTLIEYLFFKSEKWKTEFAKELYTHTKLRLFFVTN